MAGGDEEGCRNRARLGPKGLVLEAGPWLAADSSKALNWTNASTTKWRQCEDDDDVEIG